MCVWVYEIIDKSGYYLQDSNIRLQVLGDRKIVDVKSQNTKLT